MKIEIDQSGKIEDTSHKTVIGDSLGNFVAIKAKDKRIIQDIYRQAHQPRKFIIHLFSLLVTLLIAKTINKTVYYVIDLEYPGKEEESKYILLYFAKILQIPLNKTKLRFKSIGKSSKAHETAHFIFKQKGKQITISSSVLIRYLLPQKKDRVNVSI